MAERAFVLTSEMGWSIAGARDIETGPAGLRLARQAAALPPLVDEDGAFGGLDLPTGVAVDALGRIYVSDPPAHVIRRYDPACARAEQVTVLPGLGGDGADVRNLREPRGLAIAGDTLFIVDAGTARLLAVTLTGLALRFAAGPIDDSGHSVPMGDAGAWRPWDVAADARGLLYVSDRRGRVFRLSRRGRFISATTLPGSGEGPVDLAIASPPRVSTATRALYGEVALRDRPRAGITSARLEQDAWLFIESGDVVEFRAPGGRAERRTVTVTELPVPGAGPDPIWPGLTWSGPLQNDYAVDGGFVRLVTAAHGGDAAPRVRVVSPAGWQRDDWLRIDGPSPDVAQVTDVRAGALVLRRSDPSAAVLEGVRLTRITPILAVADARPGIGTLLILAGDGTVLNADAGRADLAVLAHYGGLAFAERLAPDGDRSHEIDLEAALMATIGRHAIRMPAPAYPAGGQVYLGPFDSEVYECAWDRLLVEADVPDTTTLTIDSLTQGLVLTLDEIQARAPEWRPARIDGDFPDHDRVRTRRAAADRYLWDAAARDTLVQSRPGRYLYLRLTMTGGGTETPTVRALRMTFPRRSYLEYLPAVYQEDAESRSFLDRFLSIFQASFDGIDQELDGFPRFLDPKGVPDDFLPWLASWLGLSLDWPWTPEERLRRQRLLLERAPQLYRTRGTPAGLRAMISAYTGLPENAVRIVEAYCARNVLWLAPGGTAGGTLAGTCLYGRMQLDHGTALGGAPMDASGNPAEDAFATYAHRFTVVVPAGAVATDLLDASLRRLVDQERPAHTEATVYAPEARFRVGIQSVVGVDAIIGAYPVAEVGHGYLGFDTVLACAGPPRTQIGRTGRIGASVVVA